MLELGSLAAAVVVLVWMSVGGAVLVSSGFEVSVLVNSSVGLVTVEFTNIVLVP